MQWHKRFLRSIIGKTAFAVAALSAFLLFAGAPTAKANDWDDCNRRLAYTDWRLHEAIEHFGYYSSEARYWRHERHEAYERLEHFRYEWREHERREWREREWREHEWREHHRDYYGRRYYWHRDDDDD